MLTSLRYLISLFFDGLLWPVSDSPRMALVWCAVVLGLLVGWLMRWLTSRKLLAHLTEQTKAELLAIRLFADQPLGLLHSLVRLIGLVLARMACFLPAVLVLLPIGLLVEAELEHRFAWRPLRSDETIIVQLKFTVEGWRQSHEARFQGVQGESNAIILGPLQDSEERKVYWSVQLTGQEQTSCKTTELLIELSGGSLSIPLVISSDSNCVTALRYEWGPDDLRRFWHRSRKVSKPSEVENPSSLVTEGRLQADLSKLPIENLKLRYPARDWYYFSIEQRWWIVFSICFIFAVWFVDRGLRRV